MQRTRRKKSYPTREMRTRHHVRAAAHDGMRDRWNMIWLRMSRHRFFHATFDERLFEEAADLIDALIGALAQESEFGRDLEYYDWKTLRVELQRGSWSVPALLLFWQDKRESYQKLFRRERPDPRDAAALRRASRMLYGRRPAELRAPMGVLVFQPFAALSAVAALP